MKNIFKSFVIMLVTAFVLTACGGGSSDSGPGAMPAGTFTKQVVSTGIADAYGNMFTDNYSEEKVMMLYRASNINGSGMIQSISFKYDALVGSASTCSAMTIKMGHTSVSVLDTTYGNNVEEGKGTFETVLDSASVTIPAGATGNYFTIPLSKPFNYNGVDNLVIQITRTANFTLDVPVTAHETTGSYICTVYNHGAGAITSASGNPYVANADIKFVFAGGDNIAVAPETFTTGSYYPFGPTAGGLRVQQLYLASEINGSGIITGIAFPVADAATAAESYTITVRLGHTNLTELTDTFASNINVGSPATVANSAVFNVPAGMPAGTYIWLPLPDGTFSYNGTDNLVVEIQADAVATETLDIQRAGKTNGRLYGALGAPTGTLNSMNYAIKFRFYGGTVNVIDDAVDEAPVFGSASNGLQFLLRAAELGTSGSISKLAFRLSTNNPDAVSYPNFTVTLAHTTQDALVATDATNVLGGTTVYNTSFNMPSNLNEGDWVEIPLITPFNYNGKDNLVVQITSGAATPIRYGLMSWDTTQYAGLYKLTGGMPADYRGVFKFWVNK